MQAARCIGPAMPSVPRPTTCSTLGCHEPRSRVNSFCLQHGGRDNFDYRPLDKIYSGDAWAAMRRRQLSRQPLCQACRLRDVVALATEVDHVFPWKLIGPQAFKANLFQSLCKGCHSLKGASERRGRCLHYSEHGERCYAVSEYQQAVGET